MIKKQASIRKNISNRDKIRVNSPGVHFSITRKYPEVGLKIIIF
jgi:hypothetical protein